MLKSGLALEERWRKGKNIKEKKSKEEGKMEKK